MTGQGVNDRVHGDTISSDQEGPFEASLAITKAKLRSTALPAPGLRGQLSMAYTDTMEQLRVIDIQLFIYKN